VRRILCSFFQALDGTLDISLGVVATSHLVLISNTSDLSTTLREIAGILRATVFSRRLEHLFVRFHNTFNFRRRSWNSCDFRYRTSFRLV
jgi:hypothetical protein